MKQAFDTQIFNFEHELGEISAFNVEQKDSQTKKVAEDFLKHMISTMQNLRSIQQQLMTDEFASNTYRSMVHDFFYCQQFFPDLIVDEISQLLEKFREPNLQTSQVLKNTSASYNKILQIMKQPKADNQQEGQKDEKPIIVEYINLTLFKEKFKKLKKLLKKPTFVDAFIHRLQGVADKQVQIFDQKVQFTRLLYQSFLPVAANNHAYGRSIYVGKAIEPKFGVWVPQLKQDRGFQDIQQDQTEEVQKIQVHIVMGRIFVTKCQFISEFMSNGLRLARLAQAVDMDGELRVICQRSYGEQQAAMASLFDCLSQTIQVYNEKNLQTLDTQVQSLFAVKNICETFPFVLQNDQFNSILEECYQKTVDYYQVVRKFRAIQTILFNKEQAQQEMQSIGVVLTSRVTQNPDVREDLSQLIDELVKFQEIHHVKKEYQQNNFEVVDQDKLFAEQDETREKFEKQLNIDYESDQIFQIKPLNQDLNFIQGKQVKVQIVIDNKTAASDVISLQDCIRFDTSDVIQLGADLSIQLSKPLIYYGELDHLPKIKIQVVCGSHTVDLLVPIKVGESSSTLEANSQHLELSLGYYLNIFGGGYNPKMGVDLDRQGYDPNMNFRVTTAKKEQSKTSEPKQMTYTSRYKGGNFLALKQEMQRYYKLDVFGDNKYDSNNYVNLVELNSGNAMQQLAYKKKTHTTLLNQTIRQQNVFEQTWQKLQTGPDGDPLFMSQYLTANRKLHEGNEAVAQTAKDKELISISWPNGRWRNPFIPKPFMWKPRDCMPVRLLMREQGRFLFQDFMKQFEDGLPDNDDADFDADGNLQGVAQFNQEEFKENKVSKAPNILGMTDQPFINLTLQLNSLFPLKDNPNISYVLSCIVNGSGQPQFQSDFLQSFQSKIQFQLQPVRFKIPLARIYDSNKVLQKGEQKQMIAFDSSDAALAILPYCLKINFIEYNEKHGTMMLLGRSTIPLRTVFLSGGLNGNIQLDNFYLNCCLSFDPPRIPIPDTNIATRGMMQYCSVNPVSYSGVLPQNFHQFFSRIEYINTRLSSGVDLAELEILEMLTEKQRARYLQRFSQRIGFEHRGITLFANTIDNKSLFINQFLMSSATANRLSGLLNLKTLEDCVEFAAAIPFVPDTVARYYCEGDFGVIDGEKRLFVEHMFQVSGGDYFEHAALLVMCLSTIGVSAFVARVCTDTLCNEYFVLIMEQQEKQQVVYLVDPTTRRRYERKDPKITRVIMLFDASRIFVNLQPDMRPATLSFDLEDEFCWAPIVVEPNSAFVDLGHFFASDAASLCEQRQRDIQALLKEVVQELRLLENAPGAQFNTNVEDELLQGKTGLLDTYDTTLIQLSFAMEDSAMLIERVKETNFWSCSTQNVEFVVVVMLRSFGLKFGLVKLVLGRLMQPNEKIKRLIAPIGSMFGIGW